MPCLVNMTKLGFTGYKDGDALWYIGLVLQFTLIWHALLHCMAVEDACPVPPESKYRRERRLQGTCVNNGEPTRQFSLVSTKRLTRGQISNTPYLLLRSGIVIPLHDGCLGCFSPTELPAQLTHASFAW